MRVEAAYKTLLPPFSKRKCAPSPLEGTAQECAAGCTADTGGLDAISLAGGAGWEMLSPTQTPPAAGGRQTPVWTFIQLKNGYLQRSQLLFNS